MSTKVHNEIVFSNQKQRIIFDHLRQHGNKAISYHTLQNDLKYYIDNKGYIAYQSIGSHILVLGDPICDDVYLNILLDKFLAKFPEATFIQISSNTSHILSQMGYYINSIGVETKLNLPFSLSGRKKSDVRHLYNSAQKRGVTVREITGEQKLLFESEHLLTGIKRNRTGVRFKNNLSFLARAPIPYFEFDVRVFGSFYKNKLVGISIFDPIYERGEVIAYAEVVPRRRIDAPKGTRVFTLIKAMEQFAVEKISYVNLGLSPFYKVKEAGYAKQGSIVTESIFRILYRYGSLFFNFKGLSFHKSRFKGDETGVYFANRNRIPLITLLKIYRATTGHWQPFI